MKAWAKSFYLSAAWEKTRAAYLMSQDYICERCGQPAKIVHHKRWLNRENINDISVTLCWDNLEALCQDCQATALYHVLYGHWDTARNAAQRVWYI